MEQDRHFQSIWVKSSRVAWRLPWCLPSVSELREERRVGQRARRLRDRAEGEGWTRPELYTAINNGCRIGRVVRIEKAPVDEGSSFMCETSAREFVARQHALSREIAARIAQSRALQPGGCPCRQPCPTQQHAPVVRGFHARKEAGANTAHEEHQDDRRPR